MGFSFLAKTATSSSCFPLWRSTGHLSYNTDQKTGFRGVASVSSFQMHTLNVEPKIEKNVCRTTHMFREILEVNYNDRVAQVR